MNVIVPPGAVSGQLQVVVAITGATALPAAPPPGFIVGSTRFTIAVTGGTPQPAIATATVVPFAQPLAAYVPYSTSDLSTALGNPGSITVQYYDPNGGTWVTPLSYPDYANQSIVAQLTHPGTYAVLIRDPLFIAPPFGISLNAVTPVPTPSPTPKVTGATTSLPTQTPIYIYIIVTATPDLFALPPPSGETFSPSTASSLPSDAAPADSSSTDDQSSAADSTSSLGTSDDSSVTQDQDAARASTLDAGADLPPGDLTASQPTTDSRGA